MPAGRPMLAKAEAMKAAPGRQAASGELVSLATALMS